MKLTLVFLYSLGLSGFKAIRISSFIFSVNLNWLETYEATLLVIAEQVLLLICLWLVFSKTLCIFSEINF